MYYPLEIENLFSNSGVLGDFFQNLIQFILILFIFAGIIGIGYNIFKLITKSEKIADCITGVVLNIILILSVIFVQDLMAAGDARSLLLGFSNLIKE